MIEQPLFPVAGISCNDTRILNSKLALMQNVFPRSDISEGEQLLWLLLVIHCAQTKSDFCHFSYQQLASTMAWKTDSIHRGLLRLRLMGFLIADLPFLHGIVTPTAEIVVHKLTPTLPELEEAKKREININLIRNRLLEERKQDSPP